MATEKKTFHLRIDMDLLKELELIAEKEHRSINSQIEHFVSLGIDLYNKSITPRKPRK